jgi:hypothetical protein
MATYRKFRDIDYGKPIIAPTHGDTVAPQNDLAAAAWLPVDPTDANIAMGFHSYDYQRHVFTDKVVIMPGKLVALTRESLTGDNTISSINQGTVGRLVPAGIRLAWKAAHATSVTVLQYTAVDVAERIEDLGTGRPVTGPKTYTKTALTLKLQERGLLGDGETLDQLISRPIGVAANVVYAWAGGDGTQPNKLRFMNYRRENKSTFWTGQDHTLRLPVAPAKSYDISALNLTTDTNASASWDGTKKLVFLGDNSVNTAAAAAAAGTTLSNYYHGADLAKVATYANVKATFDERYADLATNASAKVLVLGHQGIESNIYNTIELWSVTYATGGATVSQNTDLTSTWLAKEKAAPAGVKAAGDYFVDRDLGLLFVHTDCPATGDYLVAFRLAADVESYSGNVFAAVGKAVKPGDYLAYDKYSNFVPYVARPDETKVIATDGADDADANDNATVEATAWVDPTLYHRPEDIVGKCYTLDRSPKADLATVKTFHDYEGVSLADRTPGSANDGHPAEIHQSFGGQFAAIVRVLL